MYRKLLQWLSKLHHFLSIHHYSPFTSITHNHPFLLHKHLFFYSMFFFTSSIPSNLWPSSQPHIFHIKSYYSLHQPVCLHSLCMFKPPKHTLLCSSSQVSSNTILCTSSFLTWSIHVSPHILLRHLISITFNIFSVHNLSIYLQWSVSSNTFGSNAFASNESFEALPHLQSNDPKFRSKGNYSGHPGSNFKLPADRWIFAAPQRPSLPPRHFQCERDISI